ncbi:MAG: RAD55 family ATPase, partial [Vicinamibacteria bacterium]
MERLRTGSREADEILNGGFPTNSINIVMGQPGTGKTIFVQALAWHNANGGRPVLYCTTLAEPLPKLVRYLQELDFFDPSQVGTSVFYDDLGEAVGRQGLAGLNSSVREMIKEKRPAILIIDSFKAAQELGGSDPDVRRMTFELAGLLSAYDVTTFLIGEYHERDIRESPVFAAADGIVELMRVADDRRDERYLRVLKLRGSDYRSGLHSFTITSGGLSIYPRLASRETPTGFGASQDRIPTGIPGLDALTGGGILERGQTLLLGSPGSGKTTMAMQF